MLNSGFWVFRTLGCLLVFKSAMAGIPPVLLDPPDRLAGATVLGDWNQDGAQEGWTSNSVTVSGGILRADLSGTDLTLNSVARKPDLDLGFNDYLQIRLKFPANYSGNLQIDYATLKGFEKQQRLTIPSERIPKDGQFHTYRLDLGLEAPWRDALAKLRVVANGTLELDYIEVGDVAGTAPALNLDTNFKAPLDVSSTQRLESKHACFWWDPKDSAITPELARRALRMCEESFQVYCRKLGYAEPFQEFGQPDSPRYKVNFISWYGGFWCGSHKGRCHLNVTAGGLQDEGWGNPVPHEFGHAIQMAQPGFLAGGHWESHADYLRFQRNQHYRTAISGLVPALGDWIAYSNYRPDHNRLIYSDQRYYLALDDYGTQFGLPPNYAAIVWREGEKEKSLIEKLAGSLPQGVSVKNVAAECLKHWPMLDFSEKTWIGEQFWATPALRAQYFWKQNTGLVPQQDRPGWWRVPPERAPEAWAYMVHELSCEERTTITAELRGMDMPGTGEDWRWCLIAVKGDDSVRYSPVWNPGAHEFALEPGEKQVFLFVAATPDSAKIALEGLSNTKPVDKHPERLHYAYEVRLGNAKPVTGQYKAQVPEGTHLHTNGGGIVGPRANVAASAYVGPNTMVLDDAQVSDNARIEDFAVVQRNAKVEGAAVISGRALVEGNALVQDQARVRDRARINAVLRGRALVMGYATVANTTVADDAIVRGCAFPFGGEFMGTAIADYDYSMSWKVKDGTHFDHVPWGGWYNEFCAQTLRKPRGLIASYRTEESDGQQWWDEFGALHALLRGNPARIEDPVFSSKVLHLDGTDDYAVLDRSLCDVPQLSFGCWIKPERAGCAEPVLFLGKSATESIQLVRDASGRAVLMLGASEPLRGSSVLRTGEWIHLSFVLDGGGARLLLNGREEAKRAFPFSPLDVLAANDQFSYQANYLGRDWKGTLFKGSLEDARFYNVALSDAELRSEAARSGSVLGLFFADTPLKMSAEVQQSGVRNGRVRTLAAWVRPAAHQDNGNFRGIFDAGNETQGGAGSALGMEAGDWAVKLDGAGVWRTGIAVLPEVWQHVTVSFDGSHAVLFVDGSEAARHEYRGPASDSETAGKCFRIGFSQTNNDVASREFFAGLIRGGCILDRVMDAREAARLASRFPKP